MRRRPTVSNSRPRRSGPTEIAEREREEVEADALARHAVERAEDERIGEEERVVEERLRHHQREAQQGALAIVDQNRAQHHHDRRV
jgi:hypothetical protein